MNKNFSTVLAFLATALLFATASGFVSAAAITLTPASVEETTCICDTQITKFIASNPGDVEDNYLFSIAGTETWGVIAPFNAVLKPSDAIDVYSFITPSCFAVPGTYFFTVTGKSTTEEAKSAVTLRVNPCVKITAKNTPKTMCTGEKTGFQIELHNSGKTTSKNYSILFDGEAAPAATSSDKEVWVAAGETKTASVFIDSARLKPGVHKLIVKAVALYPPTGQPTGDADSIEIVFETRACQDIGIEIEGMPSPIPYTNASGGMGIDLIVPEAFDACIKQKNIARVKITNYGKTSDVVTLSTNATQVTLEKTSIPVPANSSVFVNAEFKPEELGRMDFVFKARSTLGVEKSILLPVEATECAGLLLRVEGPKEFCSEYGSREFKAIVKNVGRPGSFELRAPNLPFIQFAEHYVTLNTGEEKQVSLEIPAYVSPENYTLTIRAVSPNASAKNYTRFEALDCFNVRLTASDSEVCQCSDQAFPFEVINLGVRPDSYFIATKESPDWIEFNETQNFTIQPSLKKTLFPKVTSCGAQPGTYRLEYAVKSNTDSTNVWDRVCMNVTVRTREDCYRARVTLPDEEYAEPNANTTIAVRVLNNGLEENVYSLRLEAPEWVNFTPGVSDYLRIPKTGERATQLTANPPASEVGKSFIIKISAVSRGISSNSEMILRVVALGEAQKLREEKKALPLPADVKQEGTFIIVRTLPDASVSFNAGNSVAETQADSSGSVKFAANQTGVWTITIKKQGYSDTSVLFEFKQPQKYTGAFTLDATTIAYGLVLLVVAALVLYGVYLLSNRKKN
ncbi:hypothetical protein H0N96_02185 [Candidatus Micrarchaeota archaeon]|nr:hypothetical protein [Candidatus Micrarchaeota archaeon]